jgi:hypothetical protein
LKLQGIDDNFPFAIDNKKLRTLPLETEKLILTNSISPLPLHKTLILFELLQQETKPKIPLRFGVTEILVLIAEQAARPIPR